jgi:hypothetical protein
MRCRSALTRIDAMRTGELSAEERHELHDHLGTCASCDESVADVETLAATLKSLVPAAPRSCRDTLKGKCATSFGQIDDVWVAFSKEGLRMIHRGGSEEDSGRSSHGATAGRSSGRRFPSACANRSLPR